MSVNLYLRGEEVKKIPGFTVTPMSDKGRTWDRYQLPGLVVYHGDGRWYCTVEQLTDRIPLIIAGILDEVSFLGYTTVGARREAGLYVHESAEAEVDLDQVGGQARCRVKIKAKKIEDARDLFRMIKSGAIRPQLSYEGPQCNLSRSEIEEELERVQAEHLHAKNLMDEMVRKFQAALTESSTNLQAAIEVIRKLVMQHTRWPGLIRTSMVLGYLKELDACIERHKS